MNTTNMSGSPYLRTRQKARGTPLSPEQLKNTQCFSTEDIIKKEVRETRFQGHTQESKPHEGKFGNF